MICSMKSALVTGGGSGIGSAIAQALAREGASVLVTDISGPSAQATAEQIRAAGGVADFMKLDVSRAQEHAAAVDRAVSLFGGLNIACNCAGIGAGTAGKYDLLADVADADWERVIDINLTAVFYGMRAQIRRMREGAPGQSASIINITSVMSESARSNLSPYVASKHGVLGLTRAAAVDYASARIRVNAIAPGYIKTPMTAHRSDNFEAIAAWHPLGRMGEADEVAQAAVWLASDRSSFVTGTQLAVDGGYLVT